MASQADGGVPGSARFLQGWNHTVACVGLPKLLYPSPGDPLDQGYLACTPPSHLLMDDPAYLPAIQLDHVTHLTRCEIIPGNERFK